MRIILWNCINATRFYINLSAGYSSSKKCKKELFKQINIKGKNPQEYIMLDITSNSVVYLVIWCLKTFVLNKDVHIIQQKLGLSSHKIAENFIHSNFPQLFLLFVHIILGINFKCNEPFTLTNSVPKSLNLKILLNL